MFANASVHNQNSSNTNTNTNNSMNNRNQFNSTANNPGIFQSHVSLSNPSTNPPNNQSATQLFSRPQAVGLWGPTNPASTNTSNSSNNSRNNSRGKRNGFSFA